MDNYIVFNPRDKKSINETNKKIMINITAILLTPKLNIFCNFKVTSSSFIFCSMWFIYGFMDLWNLY